MMIVARNYRSGHYELDIVALDEDGLHIVEVRTRLDVSIAPSSTVDRLKQARVVAAAKRFVAENVDFAGYEVCFDVVGVTIAGEDMVLEYIPKAYIPIYL
ncbi:MAG: YraN family protein [Candidatus Cryptobacteroides sp.]